jgi:hypothetical protein
MIDEEQQITAGRDGTRDNRLEPQSIAIGSRERDRHRFADEARRLRQFRRDGASAEQYGDAEKDSRCRLQDTLVHGAKG